MAVLVHVLLRGLSREQYDAVRDEVKWLEETPDGVLGHLTWGEGDDNHNCVARESEEAFGAFGQNRPGPALAKLGIDIQPEVTFHPAHEVFTPQVVR